MKKQILGTAAATAAAVFLAAPPVAAQFQGPMPSQNAKVMQRIGVTDFTVSYSRPNVKGRKIWGELVPYGKPWRTGANAATTFTSTDDFEVEGKKLPAGSYSIVTIPGPESWIVAFNKDLDLFSKTDYDEKKDALRVTVKPEDLGIFAETFTITFRNVAPDGAQLNFIWDRLRVPVALKVDTKALVLAKGQNAVVNAKADDWETPLAVARTFFNDKIGKPGEAMSFVDRSISIKKTLGNTALKARMLAADGKYADAVKVGEEAVALAKASPEKPNIEAFEKSLAEWKAKK